MRAGYTVLFASAVVVVGSVSACVPAGEPRLSLHQQCEEGDAYACREWREQEQHREAHHQEEQRDRTAAERQQPHPAAPGTAHPDSKNKDSDKNKDKDKDKDKDRKHYDN